MNIRKQFKKILEWYTNLSFMKQVMQVYIICGILPVLCMLGYYYYSTTKLLINQACGEINYSLMAIENGLNVALQPYKTIIESLKSDRNLNTQINMDYTDISYCDLAYYLNNNIDSVEMIHPYISKIRFYSNNETLPQEGNYFWAINDLDQQVKTELEEETGSVVCLRRINKESGMSGIVMASKMNYYETEEFQNYVEIELKEELLSTLLLQKNPNASLYLINKNGRILESSDSNIVGGNIKTYFPEIMNIKEKRIETVFNKYKEKQLCMKAKMDMGLTMVVVSDYNGIIKDARKVPAMLSGILILIFMLLFMIIIIQSRRQNDRLTSILYAMKKIGSGDFSYHLEPKGNAEFGQIEKAVNQMNQQIDELIQDNYKKQLMIKSTELNLLQEQINPHFLYNALAVISSLSIREKGRKTVQSIRYLADFYRISLNKGRNIITVKEEFDLLKNYMEIQLLRFSDLVEIVYDMDEEIQECHTVKLLLQPLVENAIHHAREEEMFLTITVSAYRKDQRICFEVADNGTGMEEWKLLKLQKEMEKQEEGFGLKNVDRRIKLAYGSEYGAKVESIRGKGTKIHIEIPMQMKEASTYE